MHRPLVLAATLLMAAAALAPAALAQSDAAATADHPLVGAWRLDSVPAAGSDPLQLLLVGPGGILSDASDHGIGYGAWTPSGADTADLTFDTALVDPDAGFLGFVVVRASVQVAADGQTFAGTYTVEFPTPMTQATGMEEGEYGPNDMTGQRITVQSMGTPVGPLPGGPPSAPPGASPAA